MAVSELYIYQTNITPTRNALVEGINDYLDECGAIYYSEIQYQKLGLDISIKINFSQEDLTHNAVGNYVRLVQDGVDYYYFILNARWKAQKTLELDLSIDSINTFKDNIVFTDKTNVIREHRDRFAQIRTLNPSINTVLRAKVDNVDEGLGTLYKIKKSDNIIEDTRLHMNQQWYLVYWSPEKPTANSPIACFLVPSEPVPLSETDVTSTVVWYPKDLDSDKYYYFMDSDNESGRYTVERTSGAINQGTLGDNIRGLMLYKESATDDNIKMCVITSSGSSIDYGSVIPINYIAFNYSKLVRYSRDAIGAKLEYTGTMDSIAVLTGHDAIVYSSTINQIDRTDPKIVKIIECPYCPINMRFRSDDVLIAPDGWTISSDNLLKLTTLNLEFISDLPEQVTDLLKCNIAHAADYTHVSKNIDYEPKLWNSASYTYKLIYDTYSQEIVLENTVESEVSPAWNLKYKVQYKQSNGITSDCGFKFDITSHGYKTVGDYDTYILSSRNNESNIYTNAYLDYIRTGQYYDRKNANLQQISTVFSAGISIVGAAVGLLAAGATSGISAVAAVGKVTNALSGSVGAIINTASTENSYQAKQADMQNQTANVSGSNDLNMLKWYNGNKLHAIEYSVTDNMKQKLFDLYYYCGYATNVQKAPKLDTRYWFNFIQCEPVFNDESTELIGTYIDDIKARFQQGVTVYHRHEREYDWNQEYENFEIGLIG